MDSGLWESSWWWVESAPVGLVTEVQLAHHNHHCTVDQVQLITGTAGSLPSLCSWSSSPDQIQMAHHRHWSSEQAPLNSGKHLFVCSQSDARLSLPPTTPSSPPPRVILYTRPVEISYNLHWIPGGKETSVGIPLDEYLGALPHKPFASTQKQSVLQKKSFRVSLLPCVPQLIFFHRSSIKFAVLREGSWMGPVIQTIAQPNPRLYFTFRC